MQCSVSCNQGIQHRNVACRDGSGRPSSECSLATKPVARQPCTGLEGKCPPEDVGPDSGDLYTNRLDDIIEELQPAARSTRGWRKLDSATLRPASDVTASTHDVTVTASPPPLPQEHGLVVPTEPT